MAAAIWQMIQWQCAYKHNSDTAHTMKRNIPGYDGGLALDLVTSSAALCIVVAFLLVLMHTLYMIVNYNVYGYV